MIFRQFFALIITINRSNLMKSFIRATTSCVINWQRNWYKPFQNLQGQNHKPSLTKANSSKILGKVIEVVSKLILLNYSTQSDTLVNLHKMISCTETSIMRDEEVTSIRIDNCDQWSKHSEKILHKSLNTTNSEK